MRDFKRPDFMRDAIMGRKGHLAFVEVLIALLIFIASTVAMAMVCTPFLMPYVMKMKGFQEFMATGDQTAYMKQVQEMAHNMPPYIMIVMLIVQILMIVVIMAYCRYVENRKIYTMGFVKKGALKGYFMGAFGGFVAITIVWGINCITGALSIESGLDNANGKLIIGFFIGYLIQGLAEEVLCRGYLFVSLSRRYSVTYSAIISALFFALLHGANSGVNLLALVNIFLFGIFAALLMVKYENIWVPAAFHSIWNFVQGNLFGIKVSGNGVQPSIISSTPKQGLSVINGGVFGAEGGIGVTIVLIACIVLTIKLLQRENKIVEYDMSATLSKTLDRMALKEETEEQTSENQIFGEQISENQTSENQTSGKQAVSQLSQPTFQRSEKQPEKGAQVVNLDTLKSNRNVEIPEETTFDSNYFKD